MRQCRCPIRPRSRICRHRTEGCARVREPERVRSRDGIAHRVRCRRSAHLEQLVARQRAGYVLLVCEDEEGGAREALLAQQLVELALTVVEATRVRAVHDPDEALGLLVVVAPVRTQARLATHVPHVEFVPAGGPQARALSRAGRAWRARVRSRTAVDRARVIAQALLRTPHA